MMVKVKYLIIVINVFFKLAKAVKVYSKHAKAITSDINQMLIVANLRYLFCSTDRIHQKVN